MLDTSTEIAGPSTVVGLDTCTANRFLLLWLDVVAMPTFKGHHPFSGAGVAARSTDSRTELSIIDN